jgi:flagellar biosynthesis protein FliQ
MRSLIKSKKGAMSDLFVFMAVAFVIAMISVIMFFIATKTYTELTNKAPALQNALGNDGNATEIIDSTVGKTLMAYQSLKWITTMLIVGLAFSILITSFLVRTNPIFFVPYVIIVIIAVIVSVPISNAYETIYTNPVLAESFSGFFGQNWIFLNLPAWITIIGLFAGILMFINVVRST